MRSGSATTTGFPAQDMYRSLFVSRATSVRGTPPRPWSRLVHPAVWLAGWNTTSKMWPGVAGVLALKPL
jgi:hypothetical protein